MSYRFAEFELDVDCFELRRGGVPIELARRPFDLLLCLVERRSRVVQRQELLDVVWQGSAISDATLSHCILELRRALDDRAAQPRILKTVRGRGYRFVAALLADAAPVAAASG